MLNPVAPLLEGMANVIVRHAPPPLPWVGYSTVCAVAIFAGALAMFHALEPYFSESA